MKTPKKDFMPEDRQQCDILLALREHPFTSQRILAEETGYSIGLVNKQLNKLVEEGYLDSGKNFTPKTTALFEEGRPANAVILAAGFGMRMVPINLTSPKALMEIRGERLIDRLIDQLHEAGITDITVVVGFMQESFEYLIDEKGVDLVVNNHYNTTNNLYSFGRVLGRIRNTYIVPSDIWCAHNPFRAHELYSWYMVADEQDDQSLVRVNRKKQLVRVQKGETGDRMIGISYLTAADAAKVTAKAKALIDEGKNTQAFWEESLYDKDRMIVSPRIVSGDEAVEINTYEQLRDLDSDSSHLQSAAITAIADALHCSPREIVDIEVLKKGMTNRSFLFTVKGDKYIMRIPGEGTDQLIDRAHEAEVFHTIKGTGLCDDPVFIEPKSGYKITKYLENIRVCDPLDQDDLQRCMEVLRRFHEMDLKVGHTFDLFGQIDFYESLWNGHPSVFKDYEKTKADVFSLQDYIAQCDKQWCLTHIDAVYDNFLFYQKEDGTEGLQLTDWEYAGMQDPHVDIAMFCIYSLYDRSQIDDLIDIYFDGACSTADRAKIYCYIAACGLLWSNWCEFKRQLGVEFSEYSLRQYRYAKDYYKYASQLIGQLGA